MVHDVPWVFQRPRGTAYTLANPTPTRRLNGLPSHSPRQSPTRPRRQQKYPPALPRRHRLFRHSGSPASSPLRLPRQKPDGHPHHPLLRPLPSLRYRHGRILRRRRLQQLPHRSRRPHGRRFLHSGLRSHDQQDEG